MNNDRLYKVLGVSPDVGDEELKARYNELVKQYQKLFDMDHVELVFEDDALDAIAEEALKRKTGARGLRAILENVMMDIMFDIPSREDIARVRINKDAILGDGEPILEYK